MVSFLLELILSVHLLATVLALCKNAEDLEPPGITKDFKGGSFSFIFYQFHFLEIWFFFHQ